MVIEHSLKLQGPLSDIRVPDDLILRNSTEIQVLSRYITLNADVKVSDILTIQDTINAINYSRICELISPSEGSAFGLRIIGEASFERDPTVEHLNGWPFDGLVNSVWFVDDEYVNFNENIEFSDIVIRDASLITASRR